MRWVTVIWLYLIKWPVSAFLSVVELRRFNRENYRPQETYSANEAWNFKAVKNWIFHEVTFLDIIADSPWQTTECSDLLTVDIYRIKTIYSCQKNMHMQTPKSMLNQPYVTWKTDLE